jgi:hypothetical protein
MKGFLLTLFTVLATLPLSEAGCQPLGKVPTVILENLSADTSKSITGLETAGFILLHTPSPGKQMRTNKPSVHTDSYGTPLPREVLLYSGASLKEIGRALSTNTFLLAVSVSRMNGDTVIYNPSSKSAVIIEPDGDILSISHE